MNKEQKMEIIMLILVFIVLIILFILVSKYDEKEINKCVNAGHDRIFCEKNI